MKTRSARDEFVRRSVNLSSFSFVYFHSRRKIQAVLLYVVPTRARDRVHSQPTHDVISTLKRRLIGVTRSIRRGFPMSILRSVPIGNQHILLLFSHIFHIIYSYMSYRYNFSGKSIKIKIFNVKERID